MVALLHFFTPLSQYCLLATSGTHMAKQRCERATYCKVFHAKLLLSEGRGIAKCFNNLSEDVGSECKMCPVVCGLFKVIRLVFVNYAVKEAFFFFVRGFY